MSLILVFILLAITFIKSNATINAIEATTVVSKYSFGITCKNGITKHGIYAIHFTGL